VGLKPGIRKRIKQERGIVGISREEQAMGQHVLVRLQEKAAWLRDQILVSGGLQVNRSK